MDDGVRETHAQISREKPITDGVVAVAVIVSSLATGSVLCPLIAVVWGVLSTGIEYLLVLTDPADSSPAA